MKIIKRLINVIVAIPVVVVLFFSCFLIFPLSLFASACMYIYNGQELEDTWDWLTGKWEELADWMGKNLFFYVD